MDEFSILRHFLSLAAAYALALPIAWNRERRAHSAGLRTFPLVAIAACGFVEASRDALGGAADPLSRVVQGLVTGVGFVGAGSIIKQGSTVHGTATAASLWATGAIGTAVGLGSYDVAVVISVFTFITLRVMTAFKQEPEGDPEP